MEIVNVTKPVVRKRVHQLPTGTVYRLERETSDSRLSDSVFMVANPYDLGIQYRGVRFSVDLQTGRLIPWRGHEQSLAVVLNATLEVSE